MNYVYSALMVASLVAAFALILLIPDMPVLAGYGAIAALTGGYLASCGITDGPEPF